jgi:hypothetical protein
MNCESGSPLSPPRNEATDASPLVVGAIAGTLAALIVVSLVISAAMARHRGVIEGRESLFQHGPSERTSIEAAWASARAATAAPPSTYAWLDRGRGVVRIPIGRAIDIVCRDGGAPSGRESP